MDVQSVRGTNFSWRNPHSASRLSQLVRELNFTEVQELLKKGSNPDVPDNCGWTSVHETAVSNSYNRILKLLLECGAFPDHRTMDGETPLFLACKHGACEIVLTLLDHNCRIDEGNYEMVTPLHIACTHSNPSIVKYLLVAGARIDAQDHNDHTPLFTAIENSNIAACELLLKAGASTFITDTFGRNPLHFACSIGNVNVFKLLMDYSGGPGYASRYASSDGFTLLMEAVQHKHFDLTKYLIDLGVDPNAMDERRILALHIAAHSDQLKMLELLLLHTDKQVIMNRCVFSPEVTNNRSLTALVIDGNTFESLVTLFNYGLGWDVLTCPAVCNNSLLNPISFMLLYSPKPSAADKLKYMKFMIERKMPLDPVYNTEMSVVSSVEAVIYLHRSHTHGSTCYCIAYLRTLLEAGADPDLMDNSRAGILPRSFRLAYRSGFTEGLSLLLKHSNLVEPQGLLGVIVCNMANSHYNFSGYEPQLIDLLAPYCSSLDYSISVITSTLSNADMSRVDKYRAAFVQLKKNLKVYTLKHLCRTAVRSHLHEHTNTSPLLFRQYLPKLGLPSTLSDYLQFSDL